MNNKRPINLDLTTLHFPIMAICSILHRISGIIIFVLLPVMLYLLQESLTSFHSFHHFKHLMHHGMIKLILWGFLSALFYHFLAGVRHMIADLGYGETLAEARKSAKVLLAISIVAIIILGVWIW